MPEHKVDLASLDIDWCLQLAIPQFALKLQLFPLQWFDNGHDSAYSTCLDQDGFSFIIWNRKETTRTFFNVLVTLTDQVWLYSPCTLPRTQTKSCSFLAVQEECHNQIINTPNFSFHQNYKSRLKMEQHLCFPGMSDSIQTTLSRTTLRCFAPYCSQHQTGPQVNCDPLFHWMWPWGQWELSGPAFLHLWKEIFPFL